MSGWNDSGADAGDGWGAPKPAAIGRRGNDAETGESAASNWDGGAPAPDNHAPGATNEFERGNGGGDFTCRVCNQPGHMARDCPEKPEGGGFTGECFNCGQTGHNKADCPNPKVFKGTCRICEKEGHPAADCPDKGPDLCRNCKQEGHIAVDCKNNRVFDRENLPQLTPEDAWSRVIKADTARDLDAFRTGIQVYAKSWPKVTYREIAEGLRKGQFNVHIIALEANLFKTKTLINLQGEMDRKYQVTYQLSDTPLRPRVQAIWPQSEEENMERLKDAGLVYDRGLPYCLRCKEIGHNSKQCPEEEVVIEHTKIMCVNCNQEGHRVRDCPQPRKGKKGPMTCRNCGQEGHKKDECTEPPNMDLVTCRKCEQTGHFAKECPNEKCRNCDQTGHQSRECPEPRNPATVTCRNCDEVGHFSKECPKPRDYSRVECTNCHQMGHTKVRCKEPIAEETGGVAIDANHDPGVNIAGADDNVGDGWGNANDTSATTNDGWANNTGGNGW